MTKKKNNAQNNSNTRRIRYTSGRPSKTSRGSVGFVTSQQDHNQVHSITNPFSQEARGSKLPDSDSSKSVPISIVTRYTLGSNTAGQAAFTMRPSIASSFSTAQTISGTTVDTFNTFQSIADNAAMAAQFSTYRIVSWGFKVFTRLAPTAQSGAFRIITDPSFVGGVNTASSFFEETLAFPTSETSVQWISKPVGNAYRDYIPIGNTASWDHVLFFAGGLPASVASVFEVEVYYNLECQVALGALSSAIATPAAEHKPHIMSAAGEVLKQLGGTKLAKDAKQSIGSWIQGALRRVAKAGLGLLGSYAGIPPSASMQLLN